MRHLYPEYNFLEFGRYGGILLHPTSLPGKYGIGDLGSEAFRFIDFLHQYKQQIWQILPLGPTGYGNSPYQCFSAFAGNPFLISPEKLLEVGLLTLNEFEPYKTFPISFVDFGTLIPYKWAVLERAFQNYKKSDLRSLQTRYENFINDNKFWLKDYALFMSIKKAHDFKAWNEWDEPLRLREPKAIKTWRRDYTKEINFQMFTQFLFYMQWSEVKEYANQKGVKIIGDIPIFVAYDSVDVWAHPDLYYLDDQGELIYVAGVPPDYFSKTGQRWGNPLYRWDIMKNRGFTWWIERIKHILKLQVDILRIDHFRGFEAYWRIPAEEATAEVGEWIPGPGIELFLALKKAFRSLPIIAEDLGVITPEVENLLQQTGFPGMKVLHFAFEDEKSDFIETKYLPHHYTPNCIVYTGTHDNDTTLSWFCKASQKTQSKVLEYTNSNGEDIVGDLIRLAWSSVAKMSVVPAQDVLRLGSEGRMNLPGSESGNWEWRFTWDQFIEEKSNEIAKLSKIYQRGPI